MANCGLLLNDGTSFLLLNNGSFLLLNDTSCSAEPGAVTTSASDGGGVGGFSTAWARYAREKIQREKERQKELAEIRQSHQFKRLQSKLEMYRELLLDDPYSHRIKERIKELEHEIATMQWIR